MPTLFLAQLPELSISQSGRDQDASVCKNDVGIDLGCGHRPYLLALAETNSRSKGHGTIDEAHSSFNKLTYGKLRIVEVHRERMSCIQEQGKT